MVYYNDRIAILQTYGREGENLHVYDDVIAGQTVSVGGPNVDK